MTLAKKSSLNAFSLKRAGIAITILWTLILSGFLSWLLHAEYKEMVRVAHAEAQAQFNKDMAFRFWGTKHGGVYVPVTEESPPNPYLTHVKERDITTPSGRKLTLMNPAYMMRQLMGDYAKIYGVKGHITSRKVLNPLNTPSEWEKKALAQFELGAEEFSEFADLDGEPHLRYMHRIDVKQGCLKCHALQGYKVGDVRGGVGLSQPLGKMQERMRKQQQTIALVLGTIWLLGLTGIMIGYRQLERQVKAREAAYREVDGLNQELEERVKRRTAELHASNQELEAFAYSVSHDLRAPLRGIDGFSLALQEDCEEQLPAEGRDYLSRIRKGTQRMGQLIDDLLHLSRLSRRHMHYESVNLGAIASELFEELAQTHPERTVATTLQEDLTVTGDPALLRVVLENLIGNAWKFTGQIETGRIEFGRTGTDQGEAFFVRDNGAGFDMEYADKLFGAFQRLHQPDEFPGNGIGLATVQRAIRRHGGEVWAQSEVGQGSTFYFTLTTQPH
ncbi:MAG: ATP-binding protein [Planctomycetota bacterium]|jgi:signal transduction histidine kinase